jgi:hypothetical protein
MSLLNELSKRAQEAQEDKAKLPLITLFAVPTPWRFFQNCRRRRKESLIFVQFEPRYLGSYRVAKKAQ